MVYMYCSVHYILEEEISGEQSAASGNHPCFVFVNTLMMQSIGIQS